MNHLKSNIKNIWLAVGVISLVLLAFHWFGFESGELEISILALNIMALLLSLPCSLFVIPVLVAANHYLAMNTFAGDGLYLNTILLFVVGLMQWFWIVRFWSPAEPPVRILG